VYYQREVDLMVKKLTRHGNSLALVIDKPVLDLLNITAETPLEIRTDGRALIIKPAVDPVRKKKVTAALEKTNRRYGRVLKKLAD
jgi:antitoxin component of MazEF toxin-antitoxin module